MNMRCGGIMLMLVLCVCGCNKPIAHLESGKIKAAEEIAAPAESTRSDEAIEPAGTAKSEEASESSKNENSDKAIELTETAKSEEAAAASKIADSNDAAAVINVEMSNKYIKKMRLAYEKYENIASVARETNCASCEDVPDDYKTPEEIAAGIYAEIRELGDRIPDLIKSGLDVNIRDKKGNTLLFYTYSDEAVSALIKAGCDVNAENKKGETAIFYGKGEFNHNYKMLVEAGLDINHKDKNGLTALAARAFSPGYVDGCYEMWVDFPNFRTLELLLKAGADIDAQDNNGETLLTRYRNFTTEHDDTLGASIAEFCIEHGADVNAADHNGVTPLMVINFSSVAEMLISAGADVNAEDNTGKSVLQHHLDADAMDDEIGDNENVIETLKNAGARYSF